MTSLIIELSQLDTALDQLIDSETCLVVSKKALDGAVVVEYLFPTGVGAALIAHVVNIIHANILAKKDQRVIIDGEAMDFAGYSVNEIIELFSYIESQRNKRLED